MQAKLAQYRREVLGLEAAYKATVRHINADQAQAAVFAEAWHHICKQKKSNAPIIPRLSIMGPPGSGKSSVARFLAQSYNCVLGKAVAVCQICFLTFEPLDSPSPKCTRPTC